jgi:hypothetical protein
MLATEAHAHFAPEICLEIESSAQVRGTGIAKRSPELVQEKMREGKAIIALGPEGDWAGFSYIEAWSDGAFVANSGLIIAPKYRGFGLAKRIKSKIFRLSRKRYPQAKVFSLTTTPAVMKINSEMGYKPVPYSDISQDPAFWAGCQSCINHPILMEKQRKNCLCTALLYDPAENLTRVAKVASKVSAVLAKVSKRDSNENPHS